MRLNVSQQEHFLPYPESDSDGACLEQINTSMKLDKPALGDTLTPAERSVRMGLVRGKNTKPELIVRRLVHHMGYRYRLHAPDLPGRPDLTFRPRRKIIFVHGCFWHRHDDPSCRLARLPRSRLDFWKPKLDGNRERDERVTRELELKGWSVLVIWECQIKAIALLEAKIGEFLNA